MPRPAHLDRALLVPVCGVCAWAGMRAICRSRTLLLYSVLYAVCTALGLGDLDGTRPRLLVASPPQTGLAGLRTGGQRRRFPGVRDRPLLNLNESWVVESGVGMDGHGPLPPCPCSRRANGEQMREDGQTPLLPAGHSASDLGPMVQRPENEARRTDGLTARVQQTGRFLHTPVETSCARAVRGRDKIRGCAPCMDAWMLGCLDASRWGNGWDGAGGRICVAVPWRPELRISANPNDDRIFRAAQHDDGGLLPTPLPRPLHTSPYRDMHAPKTHGVPEGRSGFSLALAPDSQMIQSHLASALPGGKTLQEEKSRHPHFPVEVCVGKVAVVVVKPGGKRPFDSPLLLCTVPAWKPCSPRRMPDTTIVGILLREISRGR